MSDILANSTDTVRAQLDLEKSKALKDPLSKLKIRMFCLLLVFLSRL